MCIRDRTGTAVYRDAIEAVGGEFITGLEITFPDGLPDLVSSSGGDTLRVDIVPSPVDPIVPGSGTFHVDTGSGFQQFALAVDSATSFTATFPAPTECPSSVEYFVSFDLQSGSTVTAPAGASTFSAQAADQIDLDDLYDFESPVGFTAGAPGDDATTGVWVRVDPVSYTHLAQLNPLRDDPSHEGRSHGRDLRFSVDRLLRVAPATKHTPDWLRISRGTREPTHVRERSVSASWLDTPKRSVSAETNRDR